MSIKAEVWPTIQVDSASTWTLHPGKLVSGLCLVEQLRDKHTLLVVPQANGKAFYVYGTRTNLEAATAEWNKQLETKA